jgi:hypothetical protein
MISGSKDQKSVVGVSGVDMNKSKCDVMSYKSVDRQLNSHVRIGVEATTNISEFTLESWDLRIVQIFRKSDVTQSFLFIMTSARVLISLAS